MKKKDVAVGGTYAAKVSGKVVDVRIDAVHQNGGWTATNLATKKQVRIKSAQRLRGKAGKTKASPAPKKDAKAAVKAKGAPVSKKDAKASKAPKTVKKADTAKHAATSLNPHPSPLKPHKSGLDAAARVLGEADGPMDCGSIVEIALAKGYWQTKGKTPRATVYAAIIREIQKKGGDARFHKAGRGRFTLTRKEG